MPDEKYETDLPEAEQEDEEWEIDSNLNVVSSVHANASELAEEDTVSETPEESEEEEIRADMGAALEGLLFLTGDEGITLEQAMNALGTDEETTLQLRVF